VLSIQSERIIWLNFQDGNLLLNLSLYDQKGKQIVRIRDNELAYSTDPWDITFVGSTVRIQAQARDTLLSLKFDPNENVISFNEAKLRFAGYEVLIDRDGINMPASFNGFKNCRIEGAGHLFNYGGECSTAAINLPGAKAY
jgi:trigger factor